MKLFKYSKSYNYILQSKPGSIFSMLLVVVLWAWTLFGIPIIGPFMYFLALFFLFCCVVLIWINVFAVFLRDRCGPYEFLVLMLAGVQFVLLYAEIYKAAGLDDLNNKAEIVHDGFSGLVFSLASLTTLSFGDYGPSGRFTEMLAYSEVFLGYFFLALTVTILPMIFKNRLK
ncbi:MAG: hypothetical protein KGH75_10975 [Rhodospirillales bacterium]|nr:hypothetical protein [Rhodospirillales bacterium]